MQKKTKLGAKRLTEISLGVLAVGLLVVALVSLFGGGGESPVPDGGRRMPEYIGARLGIINYVDDELTSVFIDKQWAGNAAVLSSRSGTCCVRLPTHWVPGMKMLISWASASMYTTKEEPPLVHRMVEVLPYKPFYDGYVWVIFLPGGVIRVQPSKASPGAVGFLNGLPYPRMATKEQIEQFVRDTAPHKGP